MIELEQQATKSAVPMASIKVIGVGGAGGNTVNNIIGTCHQSIECIVANTDAQALEDSLAEKKIQLGIKSTRGLGTGADPELGKRAAEEDIDKVMEEVKDADIVFLTAGMGGGTGSGALPVIAHALKEKGVLSIAIVTKPFIFEGKKRQHIADDAVLKLKKEVDTLIVIPNQKLLDVADAKMSMPDAFALINDLFSQSVKGISDIITKAGYINVDFADVRNIMKSQGLAVMGTASASGQNRAQEAAFKAISSPLLENMSIAGAHGVLLNITGGPSLGLQEVSAAASVIYDQVDEDAQIIIGSVIDDSMQDEVSVTIIATGFECPIPDMSIDPVLAHHSGMMDYASVKKEQSKAVYAQSGYVKKTIYYAEASSFENTSGSKPENYVEAACTTEPASKPIETEMIKKEPVVQEAALKKPIEKESAFVHITDKRKITNETSALQSKEEKVQEKDLIELSEEEEDAQIRALLAADEQKEKEKEEATEIKATSQGDKSNLVCDQNDLDVPTFLREKDQKTSSPNSK